MKSRIAVVCRINKIFAGEIPHKTQVKNRRNRNKPVYHQKAIKLKVEYVLAI